MLYNNFGPLTPEHGKIRIFAPVAYPTVRQAQIIPIVHMEALSLSSWFPICWHINKERLDLVALRTLRKDGSHQPPGSPETPSSLPWALRAYPFVASMTAAEGAADAPLIEDATADAPTDIGAPILLPDGRAGRGTQMRLRTVTAYQSASPLTGDMTAELSRMNLLEAWPLEFQIGNEFLVVESMLIVRQSAFGTASIVQFMKTFSAAGAMLLAAHRISLFRAGSLVSAARNGPSSASALA